MLDCTNHQNCIVVYNGENCPLCAAEETLRKILADIDKSMEIIDDLKKRVEESKTQEGQSHLQ